MWVSIGLPNAWPGSVLTICSMPCSGDPTQNCGGYNAMSVIYNPAYSYKNTVSNGYVKTACIQEVEGRSLRGAAFRHSAMTVNMCTQYCSARGFSMAGVEYGQECYCGSQFAGGASLNLVSDQCYMACAGNSAENCGGPNALFVFINPNPISVGDGLPTGWSAKGCIAEPNGGRALTFDASNQIPKDTLTNELCAQTCSNLGYTMSGAEYGSQCEFSSFRLLGLALTPSRLLRKRSVKRRFSQLGQQQPVQLPVPGQYGVDVWWLLASQPVLFCVSWLIQLVARAPWSLFYFPGFFLDVSGHTCSHNACTAPPTQLALRAVSRRLTSHCAPCRPNSRTYFGELADVTC